MKKPPAHSTHQTLNDALLEVLRIVTYWRTKGSGQ